jgi:hypothetical protein
VKMPAASAAAATSEASVKRRMAMSLPRTD